MNPEFRYEHFLRLIIPLLLLSGVAVAQGDLFQSSILDPAELRLTPTFGTAQIDVRGDVEISTFLFEDPQSEPRSPGKVFRSVSRYALPSLEITSTRSQPLSRNDVRHRLRHPSVVLLKNGSLPIRQEWLSFFRDDVLLISVPPAPAEIEEISDSNATLSPRYGQNAPEFVIAVGENPTTLTLQSVQFDPASRAKALDQANQPESTKNGEQSNVTESNQVLTSDYPKKTLARIRFADQRWTLTGLPSNSQLRFPIPCLSFQLQENQTLPDFYLSILKSEAFLIGSGMGLLTHEDIGTATNSSSKVSIDRAFATVEAKSRLRALKKLVQLRDIVAATQEVDAIIQLDPEDPYLHYLRAYILKQSGRPVEAKTAVVRGVECERSRPAKDWYQNLEWLQGPSRAWLDECRQELSSTSSRAR